MDQKNLYKQYTDLTRKIIENKKLGDKSLNENIWSAISKNGIWKLAVAKKLGGKGQSWQDAAVAMDAVFCQCFNTDLLNLFISQINIIYLISQYGTSFIKDHYLPRLMKGEVMMLYHSYSKQDKKIRKISLIKKSKICIYIKVIDKNIAFYIYEKKLNRIDGEMYQSLELIINSENEFITKSAGISVLHDLIIFERLFYSIISASFANKICKDFENKIIDQ
ncbi:MAG: acyl-CoA dehydrogenase family protein [Gammaproteobacteria bacterium]|nr:acyl-CoA dehydrogenase family protein [Gammaproteobacteria bacterium]